MVNEQAKEITVSHDTMKVNEQATSKENAECHDTNVIQYFSDSHFFTERFNKYTLTCSTYKNVARVFMIHFEGA